MIDLQKHATSISISLAAVGIGISIFVKMCYRKQDLTDGDSYDIDFEDLLDSDIRSDHLRFNEDLLRRYPDKDVLRVSGRVGSSRVFLVHKYDRVMDVIARHESFTSNPWPESRSLVTLNTMEKTDHDRIFRILKKFYTSSSVEKLRPILEKIVEEHGVTFMKTGDVVQFGKRLHMHVSLVASGLLSSVEANSAMIDEFISWNDSIIRLAAPLGGVGRPPTVSVSSTFSLVRGLVLSVPGVLGLIRRIGIFETWKLLSPYEAVFPSEPYGQTWDYPELLRYIPQYFNTLFDVMGRSKNDSPSGALFSNIGENVSASEVLATAVQLMVNMTTANAIMSMVFRRLSNSSLTYSDILDHDAPLQRNPRRALTDAVIGDAFIPKGSILLLMLGAANLDRPEGKIPATFGFGLHYCLGRHLVNLELECVSQWLLADGLDERITLSGDVQRLTDVDVGNWGFSKFNVSFGQ